LDAATRSQLSTPNQSVVEAWSAHSGYAYVIADGSKHIQPMYRLHSVTIGGVTLHDVQASGSDGDVWLLGQTFLRRLSSWSIDNKTATLHIAAWVRATSSA
jgi:predicted aspartyl protease